MKSRIYACSRPFHLGLRSAGRRRAADLGMQFSRSSAACQPIGTSPICVGPSSHRTSNEVTARPNEAASAYCVLADVLCILFTWPGCSTTRDDRPWLAGRSQFGPNCQRTETSLVRFAECDDLYLRIHGSFTTKSSRDSRRSARHHRLGMRPVGRRTDFNPSGDSPNERKDRSHAASHLFEGGV